MPTIEPELKESHKDLVLDDSPAEENQKTTDTESKPSDEVVNSSHAKEAR